MPVLTLNDRESLGRVVERNDTVVIDFWASWCAPCRGFLPILERASERHPDIVFCRVNAEDHQELARAFDVVSVPTLAVVRDEILIASQPGLLPTSVLEDFIVKVKDLDMDEVRREMADAEETSSEHTGDTS